MARRSNGAGIRTTYDPEVDALAISLIRPERGVGATEISPDHYVHLDRKGRIVTIEILRASDHYGRRMLEQLPSPVERLTLAEASKESGLSPGTLRNQILAGRLPAMKRGRDWMVAEHDLLNYLENRSPRGRRSRSEVRSPARPKGDDALTMPP